METIGAFELVNQLKFRADRAAAAAVLPPTSMTVTLLPYPPCGKSHKQASVREREKRFQSKSKRMLTHARKLTDGGPAGI